MADPRETEHVECDCVPDLGPPHCHLCSKDAGREVEWSACGGVGLDPAEDPLTPGAQATGVVGTGNQGEPLYRNRPGGPISHGCARMPTIDEETHDG